MLKTSHFQFLRRLLPTATRPVSSVTTASHRNEITELAKERHWTAASNFSLVLQRRELHLKSTLRKYIKKSSHDETDSEDEADPEFKDERDSKVVKAKVNSLRADLLIKAGLSLARNKVEAIFYESKVRVNGEKLPKKSVQLNVGDEIDIIRGFSQSNPSHLVIARVIVLSASEREEGLSVSFRRYKSLLVENYSGVNAFKSSETVNI